ncbi:MAG: T9SS type A sorting domain-containing protein [Bacteroidota bacterium]
MFKPVLSLLALLLMGTSAVFAQTILDFETPATTTTFQYFGSSLEAQLTSTVPNPHSSGQNTSATVLEFKKPVGCQVWAGAFSNPNPSTPVNVVSSTKISIKVHYDHIGNLTLKLEGAADGAANWVQTVPNTKVGEWETLVFDVTIPSIEAPNMPAAGHIYNTITLFTDFGSSPAADAVSYLDEFKIEQVITCNTVLDFEAAATSTTFQHFGSSLEPQLTTVIANPNPTGINTSANVMQLVKPSGSQVWAGAFSNPNPTTPVNLLTGGMIKIKFHTNHPGNLTLKLEAAEDASPNWVQTVTTDVVNQWVELTFDPSLPSIEAPNTPANGHIFDRITLFADFGVSPTSDQTFYIDDIKVCTAGSTPKADVTFKLDLKQFTGNFTNVYVSGSFNSWSGDANPLTDADGDKIYEAKLNIPVGLYEYKFTMDNWAQQEQFDPTTTCTQVTVDGANIFVNRKLVLSQNTTVGPVCFNSCYGCGDAVKITVNLGMGTYTPDAGGVYLAGGGDFGNPGGRFRMGDPDGDGVFSIRIERPRGYSTFYDFANGACPDYSCKENLAGQPCAVPTNYNDRWLSPVQQDTVINTCFASCATNTACSSGTTEVLANGWLRVQPSLATDEVRLNFATIISGKAVIRVFDATGNQVTTELGNNLGDTYTLPVNTLPKGLYVVSVNTSGKVASARFVKM